ncbi:MAG: preprotein translocase subunit SecE [Clostridia bacterium]|nr:preprotein translocase subunit SecE [Clostridia bacterium]
MAAKKNDVKPTDAKKKGKKNIFARFGKAISTFFKNIVAELKKVTWPSKKQLVTSTISVLAVCLVVGVVIFASDSILTLLMKLVKGISG